ncbi:DUF5694 domain-containing protein [Chengkuizengella sediminis]|uniref:DUF5694 domain-containing protein n=1 Tax=Chengkuizengella sediminis TaxID=1885917 RepID=UPI00138A177E|nr:DUF5694 domain-containing protein [Chengkuizengella sediminis]NDI35771.1 hypothetical protein [Chengkuizengella sediminis]
MEIKKEIILVGTFHFEQEKRLIEEKNLEILELVNYLSELKPFKIALEYEKSQKSQLNKKYKNHNNVYDINEIEQLGFRLANQLQHEEVFPVNWDGKITEDDLIELNQTIQSKYPEISKIINSYSQKTGNINPASHLLDIYKHQNDKDMIDELENMYLSFATVEKDGASVGVDFLNKWIERELMIFKNIIEISDKTNERILLIIGSDHLWMLQKLFEGNGWTVWNPFSNCNYTTPL